jgi:hypothetical protein
MMRRPATTAAVISGGQEPALTLHGTAEAK